MIWYSIISVTRECPFYLISSDGTVLYKIIIRPTVLSGLYKKKMDIKKTSLRYIFRAQKLHKT